MLHVLIHMLILLIQLADTYLTYTHLSLCVPMSCKVAAKCVILLDPGWSNCAAIHRLQKATATNERH